MLEQMKSTQRSLQVVFIDHSFNHQIGWFDELAKSIKGVNAIFLTDKLASVVKDTVEVINVNDVAQNLELEELEEKLDFPIYRALVVERAYFDYTTFTKHECYSRLNLSQIGQIVRPYLNALDDVIGKRADLVIGHLADNAIASLAGHVAKSYGVPYAAPYPYYWWPDGFLFVDQPDETSSEVDRLYRHFHENPGLIDRVAVEQTYSKKRVLYQYSDALVYPFRARVKKILESRSSHDPFSPANWLARRWAHLISQIMIAWFTRTLPDVPAGKRYVLFPMQVAPEASLLGTMPELAEQFALIKNLSINLPWGIRLCVKKHPGQYKWSGPAFDFYRKLEALKNVDVIDAKASTDRMLSDPNCIAVTVINSTVGLEAALARKPVFVFGRAIYGRADCFLKPKDFEEFARKMLKIVKGEFQFNESALLSILAAMDAAVWHGETDFINAKTRVEAALGSISAIERYIRSNAWRTRATMNRASR